MVPSEFIQVVSACCSVAHVEVLSCRLGTLGSSSVLSLLLLDTCLSTCIVLMHFQLAVVVGLVDGSTPVLWA